MRLRLIQLPPLPSYRLAAAVQELVRRQFLLAKESEARRRHAPTGSKTDNSSSSSSSSSTLLSLLVPPPPPTVIAFTPQPTYTLGRRQSEDQLSQDERQRLTAPLTTVDGTLYTPSLVSTLRGGLTTYHGPGQAVLWPILDLKSTLFRVPLTVRAYSRLLETTTATVLKRRFGLDAYTTEDPGLWVKSPRRGGHQNRGGAEDTKDTETEERKIAALGVHLRRNISALGVAVNLDTPVTWGTLSGSSADASLSSSSPSSAIASDADSDESINPWTRFVPCGLSGKGVACVADEARLRFHGSVPAAWDLRPAPFAAKWASALAVQLGLQDPELDVADQATVTRMLSDAEELLARGAGEE